MDLAKYEEIFRRESDRYLGELEEMMREAQDGSGARPCWEEMHGKIHSIKGMARALSRGKISDLCHRLEAWCKALQDGMDEDPRSALDTLEEGIELLKLLVAREGDLDSPQLQQDYSQLVARLETPPSGRGPTGAVAAPGVRPRSVFVKSIDEVRVRYTLIEELLGLGQEIQMLEKTVPPIPEDETLLGVQNWIDDAMALMKTFFFRLSHLRLMAIEDFMALFTHAIHQLSRECEKKVQLEVTGGEIQADAALLERLREPLIHLIRNCIAHGIESPEERIAAGKPERGTIRVAAAAFKERLQLTIADDGRGIDPAPIREFLANKRRHTQARIDAMGEEELLRTILQPDYSSMKETTDIAGRGVGMSVVSQAIQHIGGSLGIRSETGKGTAFEISMPLSLSIIHAITFCVGPYTFSVPTSEVSSVYRTADMTESDARAEIDLKRFFSEGAPPEKSLHLIALKEPGAARALSTPIPCGILADRIVGNRPLMVMPIGDPLSRVGLYSGIGVMENGDISMLLDPAQLTALVNRQ